MFLVSWCSKYFELVKGLDCRPWSQAGVVDTECSLILCWWNIPIRPSLKKTSGWEYTFQHWWRLFSGVEASNSTDTDEPPYHQRCRLLTRALIINGTVFLFSPADATSKRISAFNWSHYRTLFHFASVNENWSLAERRLLYFFETSPL